MTADILLNAEDITVRFGGLLAINSVSLRVRRGEIRGLIGPNGAGKSTFFNALTGLVPLTGGRVFLDGCELSKLPAHRRAALGMRRTFQSVQLLPQFTVLENTLVGLHTSIYDNPVCNMLGLLGGDAAELDAQEKVLQTLRFLGIEGALLRRTDELSFMEQRFVEIARAIVSEPKILFLDEPAAGLSPTDIQHLDTLLRRLRDERGITIVLVEHVLSLVMGISEVITVLDDGNFVCEGTASQVVDNPIVQSAYLGGEDYA
jgi:branched-chain amino acid transport system ATP-binding protein